MSHTLTTLPITLLFLTCPYPHPPPTHLSLPSSSYSHLSLTSPSWLSHVPNLLLTCPYPSPSCLSSVPTLTRPDPLPSCLSPVPTPHPPALTCLYPSPSCLSPVPTLTLLLSPVSTLTLLFYLSLPLALLSHLSLPLTLLSLTCPFPSPSCLSPVPIPHPPALTCLYPSLSCLISCLAISQLSLMHVSLTDNYHTLSDFPSPDFSTSHYCNIMTKVPTHTSIFIS